MWWHQPHHCDAAGGSSDLEPSQHILTSVCGLDAQQLAGGPAAETSSATHEKPTSPHRPLTSLLNESVKAELPTLGGANRTVSGWWWWWWWWEEGKGVLRSEHCIRGMPGFALQLPLAITVAPGIPGTQAHQQSHCFRPAAALHSPPAWQRQHQGSAQ